MAACTEVGVLLTATGGLATEDRKGAVDVVGGRCSLREGDTPLLRWLEARRGFFVPATRARSRVPGLLVVPDRYCEPMAGISRGFELERVRTLGGEAVTVWERFWRVDATRCAPDVCRHMTGISPFGQEPEGNSSTTGGICPGTSRDRLPSLLPGAEVDLPRSRSMVRAGGCSAGVPNGSASGCVANFCEV